MCQQRISCVSRHAQSAFSFALFISPLGELMGRLRLLKPSGSVRPICESAVVKVTVRDGMQAQSTTNLDYQAYLHTVCILLQIKLKYCTDQLIHTVLTYYILIIFYSRFVHSFAGVALY